MTHPGEQFYPQGVRWDDPIARGTLPDLLSTGGRRIRLAAGASNSATGRSATANSKRWSRRRPAPSCAPATARTHSVALFLGNSPDHPVNFFGALKAGARVVHLSPLDGEIALSHKLTDSGARVLVTSNLSALLPTALKFLDKGLLDRLIVCEDDDWGKVGTPQTALPDNPAIITYRQFIDGATKPAQWPAISADDVALLQYTGGTTGLPKGAMLSHGNLTSAVSIYDVWGKPSRAERNAIERVICVLPLFHIFALTVVLLSAIRRGHLISLHQRFDVEAVMRDIEVKRATAFPGVPTMWIAIAALPDLDKRDLSSLVSVGSGGAPLPVEVAKIFERKVGMKLKSGWGMTETCSPGTAHPKEGPDKPGSIGLMLPGIEMDVVSLDDPDQIDAGRRGRRNPHPRAERHQGLLEPAEGNRGSLRRRPLPHRRHRLHGRRRLFLSGRPQEGHDHLRRLQRLSADDRAGDLHPSVRAGSDRDRHSRRLSRRGRKSLHQAARGRKAVHGGRIARLPRRQARQARDCRPRSSSSRNCRARRSANCRATNCACSNRRRRRTQLKKDVA